MSEAEILALVAHINERLHRMTMCNTQVVRMQLCAELKCSHATLMAALIKQSRAG